MPYPNIGLTRQRVDHRRQEAMICRAVSPMPQVRARAIRSRLRREADLDVDELPVVQIAAT